MATYYIDPEWTGTASGTFALPYTTYASLPSLSAGDFVLQKEDTTFSGHFTVGQSGSAGSPITFGVYNKNTGAQITNKIAVARWAGVGSAASNFTSGAQSYITIMGFEFQNVTASRYALSIGTAATANGCIVSYCRANNLTVAAGGISLIANPGYPGHTVTRCELSYNAYGIIISGSSGGGYFNITYNTCNYNAESGIRTALATTALLAGKFSNNECNHNGTIAATEGKGIGIDNLSDNLALVISNNTCKHNFSMGIRLGSNSSITNAPLVKENNCSSNGQYGIQVSRGVGWVLTKNICNSNGANRGSFYGRGIEIYSSNGSFPAGPGVISYNVCNNNYNYGGTLNNGTEGVGIGLDDNHRSVSCFGNICFNNEGSGIQVNPSGALGTSTIVGNLLVDNFNKSDMKGTSWVSIILSAIYTSTTEANLKIWNNTIINTKPTLCTQGIAEGPSAVASGVEVVNNVFIGFPIAMKVRTGIVRTNNAFWNNTVNVQTYNSTVALGDGTGAVITNPLINSQYIPTSSSPLVAAGTSVGNRRDALGNLFKTIPSIGAYEQPTSRGTR